MSRSARTYQTETTLNVSQDYETPVRSSPPASAPPVSAEKRGTVLVEDSLGAEGKAPIADGEIVEDSVENGVVRAGETQHKRLSQQVEDDHDELYSLTPERPRAQAVQKPTRATQPAETLGNGRMNAVDALLARGATVHKAKQNPSEVKQAPVAIHGEFTIV